MRIHSLIVLSVIVLATGCAHPRQGSEDVLSDPKLKQFAPGATELGWKYFNQGDYDTALKRFQMAIRHDPEYAPAYYGVAFVYSNRGKLDEAIHYYRESLKRDATHAYTYANLGYALLQKEQFDEALRMLDKALALDPKCGEAYLSYVNYYAFKQEWKLAEQSANQAMKYGEKLHPELRKALQEHGVRLEQ